MGYGFRVEVWGDLALFSRPEFKVERVSYDCMTPSAARGLLEAVFWKPAIRYVIDDILVMRPIRFANVRRNEVSEKISARSVAAAVKDSAAPFYLHTGSAIQQRAATLLRDVRYVVTAHFELTDRAGPTDTPEKFYNMILRRLRKGQNFHQPYLGTREFPARLRLVEPDEVPQSTLKGELDLGFMLYDMDYSEDAITPAFFRAVLRDGLLDLRNCEVLR